jgi:hypothetical protein
MKFRITLMLLCFLSVNLFAQEPKKKLENTYAAPLFGIDFYRVKGKKELSGMGYNYKGGIGYSAGLDLAFPLHEKFYLSIQPLFSKKVFERTDECLVCDASFKPTSKFNNIFFDLPISGYYMLMNKKLDIFLIAGIQNSILLKSRETRTTYMGDEVEFNSRVGFNKFIFGINSGVGFNYTLSYRLSAGLNLLYKFSLIKLEKTLDQRYNYFSPQGGLYYRF